MKTITVKAPVNIAVIKYWGKVDEEMIIPLNDSISGTLSIDDMCAQTSIAVSDKFTEDKMWLNGQEVDISSNKRLVTCLKNIRSQSPVEWSQQPVHICSENNFPTAAGLASSAAGYACLMYALGKLFGIESVEQISTLARMGSGSACRSVYGGFVQWVKGHDSKTSIAKQIVDEKHWPEMRVLVLVVNDNQKDTSSTSGMQLTVKTSPLMKYRVESVLPERVRQMTAAIKTRDFQTFAELTMKDSNQFHALCEDTYPPLNYINDTSRVIRKFVHKYNEYFGVNRVAYTFDAGPNACLYLLASDVSQVVQLLLRHDKNLRINGSVDLTQEIPKQLNDFFGPTPILKPNSLRYIISTRIGSGPQIVTDSLLNETGYPKRLV